MIKQVARIDFEQSKYNGKKFWTNASESNAAERTFDKSFNDELERSRELINKNDALREALNECAD